MDIRYEIVVHGRFDGRTAPVVGVLEKTDVDHEQSTLVGSVPDHAALRGLLANLDDLGFGLVSVTTDRG